MKKKKPIKPVFLDFLILILYNILFFKAHEGIYCMKLKKKLIKKIILFSLFLIASIMF